MPPPRRRTRKKQGGKGGSRRGRPGGSANKRSFKQFRDRNRPSPSKRTTTKFDDRGRESGIAAANQTNTNTKIKSLEQSVGSLDRRINNALEKGNTDLAKDLRSRLNTFTTRLGDERAKQVPGGVLRTDSGAMLKTSDGRPVFTNAGLASFQDTKNRDFLDPTRKLQNEYPKEFAKMYPVTNQLQQGLPGTRLAKGLLGIDQKQIPYAGDQMPGERYLLDTGFGAGAGAGEPEAITIDDFDKGLDVAPPGVPLNQQLIIPKVKPKPDASDPSFLELLLDANRNEPGIQVFNTNPTPGEDRSLNLAPNFLKDIGTAFDADPNTPGIQVFNTNPSGNRNVNMQVKEPPITGLKDENIIMPGTQVSGENFANQVAENNMQLKQNVVANPELNDQQKELILKEIDDLTGFESTSMLPPSNADPVEFDQYVGDALANLGQPQINTPAIADPSVANPQTEADALSILNSLDNTVDERSLFERLFDSNPDQPGTQFINLNPNR